MKTSDFWVDVFDTGPPLLRRSSPSLLRPHPPLRPYPSFSPSSFPFGPRRKRTFPEGLVPAPVTLRGVKYGTGRGRIVPLPYRVHDRGGRRPEIYGRCPRAVPTVPGRGRRKGRYPLRRQWCSVGKRGETSVPPTSAGDSGEVDSRFQSRRKPSPGRTVVQGRSGPSIPGPGDPTFQTWTLSPCSPAHIRSSRKEGLPWTQFGSKAHRYPWERTWGVRLGSFRRTWRLEPPLKTVSETWDTGHGSVGGRTASRLSLLRRDPGRRRNDPCLLSDFGRIPRLSSPRSHRGQSPEVRSGSVGTIHVDLPDTRKGGSLNLSVTVHGLDRVHLTCDLTTHSPTLLWVHWRLWNWSLFRRVILGPTGETGTEIEELSR